MVDPKDKDEVQNQDPSTPDTTPAAKAPADDTVPPQDVIVENERQARGLPNPAGVMSPPPGFKYDPVAEAEQSIRQMKERGALEVDVRAEQRSLKSLVDTSQNLLSKADAMGTVEDPRRYLPVDPGLLAEGDRINMALAELKMDDEVAPRDRNGLTARQRILSRRDETIPGGYYIVGGQAVNAAGRRIE